MSRWRNLIVSLLSLSLGCGSGSDRDDASSRAGDVAAAVTPGYFELKCQNSATTLDIFMWRGGQDWCFDYYCFEGANGKMLPEHIEILAVTGPLPEDWQDVVVEKMGSKEFDAATRLLPRTLEFSWECPDTIAFPDPTT
jgi:hypothetical protein